MPCLTCGGRNRLNRRDFGLRLPNRILAGFFVGVALLASGCNPENLRETPTYSVFWNGQPPGHDAIYISSENDLSFKDEVIHTRRISSIPLRLSILNFTGRDLFMDRLGETPGLELSWKEITMRPSGPLVFNGHGKGSGLVGYGETLDLLVNWKPTHGPFTPKEPLWITLNDTIPLHVDEDTQYVDLEVKIPLRFWAKGAMEPKTVYATKSMRIEFAN